MASSQIDDLFAQTLMGDFDDELPWQAVCNLRRVGTREVFNRAAEWCSSDAPLKRSRGTDVLAQLGKTVEHPNHSFPEDSFAIVSGLLRQEKDPLPLLSAIHALGHIGNPLAVPLIMEHHLHDDADVRFAVACALGQFANDRLAIQILIKLMQDVDDDVRDWATFGLGVLGNSDSSAIRKALWDRLTDPNQDVREEALVGLAKRKDPRIRSRLITELQRPEVPGRVLEAAEEFLDEKEGGAGHTPADYLSALTRN